ncbi:hypothetical protein HOP50_04g33390 [Chloropicon primus]|uniref:Uncharacterized protein n=2 Tax=Chloropicon primus TaxID=1764295 RepID=A0A5B8MJM9_9CHLO|nr:hypothetical protein A3770_04p33360 [Chloropicon primus]UPR00030.1 hypothetical protein HOP50_04g33390 [Chloropicon primus]|eukprot:QDZ20818.1 hypothetical protein A3770_04p33360 [Chloropicon primus]
MGVRGGCRTGVVGVEATSTARRRRVGRWTARWTARRSRLVGVGCRSERAETGGAGEGEEVTEVEVSRDVADPEDEEERGYKELVEKMKVAAEGQDCEQVGRLVPEVENALETLLVRARERDAAGAEARASGKAAASEDGEEATDAGKIETLVRQVTELSEAKPPSTATTDVENIKKMRKKVEALQRELVRQELKVVMRDVESNLDQEERELDEFLGLELGLEAQKLNYISVTFLTVGVASLAWALESLVLGEDTSWWWKVPTSLAEARDWIGLVSPPLLLAGLTQLPTVKPVLSNFQLLDEYLEQTFSYDMEYMKVDELTKPSGDAELDGSIPEATLPFPTYLCFDTAIIGSELIVALGFLQGLLLENFGVYGWAKPNELATDLETASMAMGSIVNTLPVSTFSSGPFVVLVVAAMITSIDLQLNEVEKREDELLSELVYNPDAMSNDLLVDGDLKSVVKYLKDVRNVKVDERVRAKEALKQKVVGTTAKEFPERGLWASKRVSELAKKLSNWQTKQKARRKYVWIEAAYWLYLTSEVYLTHSLVPSILTALSIETFSWYRLYKATNNKAANNPDV